MSDQNIYIAQHNYPAQRRPSAAGNVVVMLIVLSALVTLGWLLFVIGTGLLHMLGYALGGLAGVTAGIGGWAGQLLAYAVDSVVAAWPAMVWAMGRLVVFVACYVGGVYLLLHGVEYAQKEQKHRHALQARRPVTLVEYANRLSAPVHTIHLLSTAQQDAIEIPVQEVDYARRNG